MEDIYKDISEDVEKRFDTSNYEVDRPLPIRKNEKVNWSGKLWKKLRDYNQKRSYLKENDDENEKANSREKCVIKRKLKFEDFKKYLKFSQVINIVNYSEKKETNIDILKKDRKQFIKK